MTRETSSKARRSAASRGKPGQRSTPPAPARPDAGVAPRRGRVIVWVALVVVAAVGALYALNAFGVFGTTGGADSDQSATHDAATVPASLDAAADRASVTGTEPVAQRDRGGAGDYVYAIGAPGPGQPAPPIELASSAGGTFDLAAFAGKEDVLLYFQEGLMCQPCWDQLVAIEKESAAFQALGISRVVGITGDPLDLIKQKVGDDDITSPVLSDPGYAVSDAYDARRYGMMDGQMAGHTFILVGKDRTIRWRADYGGAPNYTMFVPTDVLLGELRAVTGSQ